MNCNHRAGSGCSGAAEAQHSAGPGAVPAYFSAVAQGEAQEVHPEGEVIFLLAYQSGAFEFIPGTAHVIVKTAGVYRIDYTVTVRPAKGLLNAAYAVAIDGLENPFSFFGRCSEGLSGQERAQITGMFFAYIPAGATVSLRNKSSAQNHLVGTGMDGQPVNQAALLLQRVG